MIQDIIIKQMCEAIFNDIRYVTPESLEKMACAFAAQIHKERVKRDGYLKGDVLKTAYQQIARSV